MLPDAGSEDPLSGALQQIAALEAGLEALRCEQQVQRDRDSEIARHEMQLSHLRTLEDQLTARLREVAEQAAGLQALSDGCQDGEQQGESLSNIQGTVAHTPTLISCIPYQRVRFEFLIYAYTNLASNHAVYCTHYVLIPLAMTQTENNIPSVSSGIQKSQNSRDVELGCLV